MPRMELWILMDVANAQQSTHPRSSVSPEIVNFELQPLFPKIAKIQYLIFMPLQVRNPSVELSWPSRLASTYRSPSEFELRCQPPKKLPPPMRGRRGESQLLLTGRHSLSNVHDLTHDATSRGSEDSIYQFYYGLAQMSNVCIDETDRK